jgi:cellulose synthase/poly-beta-1,6-N-acetylglucosamine synthase-like glycosyltransferase
MPLIGWRDAKVDVIIPAYNAERFLRVAIESVLAQEAVALRVIVVDDGSEDTTLDIARSFGDTISVLSQPNRGVSAARNSAIAGSTSPFIAFLDSDDIWKPGKLAKQLTLLESRTDAGLVFSDMTLFREDFVVISDGVLAETPAYVRLEREAIGNEAFLLPKTVGEALMRDNFISPSTVLVRREALVGVGAFDGTLMSSEDSECWLRILSEWRAIVVEEKLVWSRQWEGNKSADPLRLNRARLQLAEKVLAKPSRYPQGAVEYFRTERPRSLERLGRAELDGGNVRLARKYLLESFKARPALRSGLLLASTFMGVLLRGLLVRAKRATGISLGRRSG